MSTASVQNNSTAARASSSSSNPGTSGDDPEQLLNEWLGELESIIGDLSTKSLQQPTSTTLSSTPGRSPNKVPNRNTDFNRFSMANLEDTHETELDAILGELNRLEMDKQFASTKEDTIKRRDPSGGGLNNSHQRSNSIISTSTSSTSDQLNLNIYNSENPHIIANREARTESPDNDSAFSDTVSLLSSDTSSTSSGLIHHPSSSSASSTVSLSFQRSMNLQDFDNQKAAKIHLALQKLEQASVRRLFVKAFTADGASKSLLVDETMTCGHVTRLLADKNHIQMESRWALVEQLPDIQMERLYEDHELLVDKLMLWNRDSKNKILFVERREKNFLFIRPELFVQDLVNLKEGDDCSNRNFLLEEFFNTNTQIPMEGPLYLKADSKKGWKRHYFVLRGSGLYYFPKEKTRSSKDLVCLGLFNDCEIYKGFGWKKKYKAPSDFTFILHSSNELANSKTTKPLKILCADDSDTLEKWILAIRVAKYGKQLWTSYRMLEEELARDDLDKVTTRRSNSINSIMVSQAETGKMSNSSSSNSGRLSRASSSSSSGCLSDENNGFDCDFPTGTIKRKPSMKPNLPLTSMTRQLKEVGENRDGNSSPAGSASPERGGTLTRRHQHIRQRSVDSGGSAGSGSSTLKRRPVSERKDSIKSPVTVPIEPKPLELNDHPTIQQLPMSPLKSMPSCMTDSLFSLPPPPEEVDGCIMGSTLSLDSLPPPPAPNELESLIDTNNSNAHVICNQLSGSQVNYGYLQNKLNVNTLPPPPPPPLQTQQIKKIELESCLKKNIEKIYSKPQKMAGKTVELKSPSSLKLSDPMASPVTLRKKVCFEDQVMQQQPVQSPTRRVVSSSSSNSMPPPPPPRSEHTRISTQPERKSQQPSNDFLKDLQRVMRKKWQVAEKCKLEPETNPHEVLGFRDFEAWSAANSVPYYRDEANVSNWVQEHYGPDSLYENLGVDLTDSCPTPTMMVSMQKKRPPPAPPKRSETTQLTTSGQQVNKCFNS